MRKMRIIVLLTAITIGLTSCEEENETPENPLTEADVLWKRSLAMPINPVIGDNYMPAVDEDDNVYVLMSIPFEGAAMQSFDKDGNERWLFEDDGLFPHKQMPAYYRNRLYFTTDNKLICLSAADGSKSWEYNMPDSMLFIAPALSVVNDNILITLESGTAEHSYLFSFNPVTGDLNDKLPVTTSRAWFSMAARGNTVYLVYDFLHQVTVGSDGTLSLNWSKQLPGGDYTYYQSNNNDLIVSPNGNVTFAFCESGMMGYGDTLISYNSSGDLLWKFERPFAKRISADADGNIYDGGIDDLVKLSQGNGEVLWTSTPPSETMGYGNAFTSMVHAADGIKYCGDELGIYGVDKDGDVKYALFTEKITGGSMPLTDITLLSNGNIIVLSTNEDSGNGYIYCIEAETGGVATSGWPKRGGNAANTFHMP